MTEVVDRHWRQGLGRRWELVETRIVGTVEPEPDSGELYRWRVGDLSDTCDLGGLAMAIVEQEAVTDHAARHDSQPVRRAKVQGDGVLVEALDSRRCLSVAGDPGSGYVGVGWHLLHGDLWCLMGTKPDRDCHVWGYVTLVEDGWMARVDGYSEVLGTLEGAMRAVENRVVSEMLRI